jgi:biotin carboxyl carrier protein
VSAQAGRAPAVEPTAEDVQNAELTQRYLAVLGQNLPIGEVHQQLAELTRELINARSVRWCAERPAAVASDDSDGAEPQTPPEDVSAVDETIEAESQIPGHWNAFLIRAQRGRRSLIEAVEEDAKCTDVAIPFPGHGVLLCRLVSPSTMLPTFVALLKMAAGYFVLADSYHQQSGGLALAAQTQSRLHLIQGLFQDGTRKQAVGKWCDHLAALSDASLVLLCVSRTDVDRCRLVSHSGGSTLEAGGETARLANRLAEETKLARGGFDVTLTSDASFKSRSALALATQLGVTSVQAVPILAGPDDPRGAAILVGAKMTPEKQSLVQQSVAGSAAALLFRIDPKMRVDSKPRWRSLRRIMIAAVTLAALAGLMAVPVPYHVRCPVALAPQIRRVVSAPFDAVLTSAMVKTGDLVAAGQPLGRLDDQPLRIELSRNRAERVRVRKQHEVLLAKGEVAEAQLTELRLQELTATISLLEDRISKATIVAPLAGVVISEDLKDVEDSPVELGQPLFEIAPLDSLRAEIEVPDYHAHLVADDQNGSLWIDDGLGSRIDGQIIRIAPSVVVRGDQSVLLCDMNVANEQRQLRPGMDGTAAIEVGDKRVGWILFHRLWNRIRVYVGA